MTRIRILPDNLANQIAAGEVVERPASVIKELVENSIDAGAERISVEVELGGRRLMRVSDDGSGMVREDAILAFERHATSKISTLDDLSKIETLGFRGEALASIASVARVELLTKTNDDTAASRIQIDGGKLLDVNDAARSTGTTITVRDLFYNTPARRKFMRSESTENFHITHIVTNYALANPEVSFVLTNNGRETFRVSPAKGLRERAFQIFGAGLLESLLSVEGGREYVARVSGFTSAPRERRTTRDSQYFFINGRFVKDKIIAAGLLEGYRSVLPHGVYPVAFLFIQVPLEEIDVNVHPAKTEVRFRRSQAVKDVIADAIRRALQTGGVIERDQFAPETNTSVEMKSEFGRFKTSDEVDDQQIGLEFKVQKTTDENEPGSQSDALFPAQTGFEIPVSSKDFEESAQSLGELAIPTEQTALTENDRKPIIASGQRALASGAGEVNAQNEPPPFDSAENIPKAIEVSDISPSKIRPIGQLHESFIIAVDDVGMLLIDQHVAHERILFDKFRRQEENRKIESQNLLLPEIIDLSPAQSAAFSLVEAELERHGFGLMRLSGRTIAVKAVPTDLPVGEVRNLFAEILDSAAAGRHGSARETLRDDLAASLACRAAVKINMPLTHEKMRWMIDELLVTSSPTTCPHGRPVILRLTMRDIERRFHRT